MSSKWLLYALICVATGSVHAVLFAGFNGEWQAASAHAYVFAVYFGVLSVGFILLWAVSNDIHKTVWNAVTRGR